jgi:hypothetical protein
VKLKASVQASGLRAVLGARLQISGVSSRFCRSWRTTRIAVLAGFQERRYSEVFGVDAIEHRRRLSRHSTAHYIQHLWTTHASGAELETQLELGQRVKVFDKHEAEILIADAQEIARMLNGLVGSLERSGVKY